MIDHTECPERTIWEKLRNLLWYDNRHELLDKAAERGEKLERQRNELLAALKRILCAEDTGEFKERLASRGYAADLIAKVDGEKG